jgi:tRNA U38,U39,U40 pseudouridine synthase TruA
MRSTYVHTAYASCLLPPASVHRITPEQNPNHQQSGFPWKMSSTTESTEKVPEKQNNSTGGSTCQGCKHVFGSRNAVFKHLKATKGICLSPEEYQQYLDIVQSQERVKTILLIGYLCDPETIANGDKVAELILGTIFEDERDRKFFNRSYGNGSRGVEMTRQDDGSGAITEILCVKIAPLVTKSVDEWIDETNRALSEKLSGNSQIRVLGRCDFPMHKFNAEMDISHRRNEYILPVDFLFNGKGSRKSFELAFPKFMSSVDNKSWEKPSTDTLDYLFAMKKTMKRLCCQVEDLDLTDAAAVMEKDFSEKKRKRQQKKRNPKERANKKVLRRKRFHNFTPRVMAHEYLSFRRLDRIYHRGTLIEDGKAFFALSMTGDLFLQGQSCRIVGLLVAILKGLISEDIIECMFDEQYLHLIPAPEIPPFALVAGEASYMSWEGKAKVIMTARKTQQFKEGFNSARVLERVAHWEQAAHRSIMKAWLKNGLDEDERLTAEREWTEQVLEPWAKRAQKQLEDYRQWKALQARVFTTTPQPSSLNSIDDAIPGLYRKVLRHLREADASGLWPSTTPKRQLVMVSTKRDCDKTDSLAMAHVKAKFNKDERSSAYVFEEGQGGASGSFSVGAFPGEMQPKGNDLFPELMKSAFELERALMPDREPSSTIAINRNAQFRPHTDSGAGAGQSTSLIVALGNYIGGELVVEGVQKDIRYKALEFNGWTQRHWTMPFQGERYSLVWFTPKGCEGIRGIDL